MLKAVSPSTAHRTRGITTAIRRYPYSTDMNINPLTFKHIVNGEPLPVGPPVAFGANGASNAEVHNTGEVWATMMWEAYASILRDTLGANPRLTFAQAQDRMKLYLVASLKMTPSSPTFTEARDAVLAAAYATDAVDFVKFQLAFAKRGAGPRRRLAGPLLHHQRRCGGKLHQRSRSDLQQRSAG